LVLPKIDLSLLQLRRALRISRKKTRLKHNHNHKRQRSNKDASDSENQINRATVHSIILFSFRALIRELVRARIETRIVFILVQKKSPLCTKFTAQKVLHSFISQKENLPRSTSSRFFSCTLRSMKRIERKRSFSQRA
jgi:hypothetical protein